MKLRANHSKLKVEAVESVGMTCEHMLDLTTYARMSREAREAFVNAEPLDRLVTLIVSACSLAEMRTAKRPKIYTRAELFAELERIVMREYMLAAANVKGS